MPTTTGIGDFSAKASSPASVELESQAVDNANSYKLEARYGDGDYFPLADLANDQTSYEHFVLPGSTGLTYRLSAGDREVGTAALDMPALTPSPLVVEIQPAMPDLGAFSGFDPNAIATVDPNNFDPNSINPDDILPEGFDPDNLSTLDPSSLVKPVSVSQEIGPEGGTVSVTAPDGAAFSLDLPTGALDQLTSITLMPVGSVTGLPLSGGLLGAVQIQPAIPFNLPLTLTIDLPAAAPAPTAPLPVGFSVSSFSNEFFLYPARSSDGSSFRMCVDWGDTYGIGSATLQDVQVQATKIPTDAGAQMAQLISVLRSSAPANDPGSEDKISGQLLEALLHLVRQIVVSAQKSPRAANAALPANPIFSPDVMKPAQSDPRYAVSHALHLHIPTGKTAILKIVRLIGEAPN